MLFRSTRVVFAARDSTGVDQLWVRRLDSPAAHVLSGTNDASYPFWSWDGRKIGFFSGGKLKKIDATGGVATAVCNAPNGRGGAWTRSYLALIDRKPGVRAPAWRTRSERTLRDSRPTSVSSRRSG